MGTLVGPTKSSDYLDGYLFVNDTETGIISEVAIPFEYKATSDLSEEKQPLKGMQMPKRQRTIEIPTPIKFTESDEVQLSDEPRRRKVSVSDFKRSKKTDMRLIDVAEKWKFLVKLVTLE